MARTKTVNIADITIDETIQQRAVGTDARTVVEYAEDMERGDEFPPVVVYQVGKDTLLLSQGFTRIAALAFLNRKTVKAEVRSGTKKDAIIDACGANADHGARRTNADKRKAVATLCEMFPKRSSRWIAETAKVGSSTVDNYRKNSTSGGVPKMGTRPEAGGDNGEAETVIGRDGKQHAARATNSAPAVPANKVEKILNGMVSLAQDIDRAYGGIGEAAQANKWSDEQRQGLLNFVEMHLAMFKRWKRELQS